MNYGTDPPRFRWNQVSLPHYTLIYPQGNDSTAYRYALYLENVYPHLTKTIGKPLEMPFPVVLHPASMTSNGMVSWSPRRMELLPTPSWSLHAEPWEKHLVIHESRHVVQTGKLMRGVFRPLYYLMGEQAAGISSALVPRWFFEGDAVGMETALSHAGRGRLPEFQMTYRAQLSTSSSPFFSFDKWYLGSYKDYTGDFYTLGYNLTAFARYKYGAEVWEKVTSRYVRRPFSFPPFARAFRRQTGTSIDGLFKETFAFLGKEWTGDDSAGDRPDYLTPETGDYTSYKDPQAWNDSTVVALKSSLSDLPALVSLTNGSEKHLTYVGGINGRIALRNNRVYWLEVMPGRRWSLESHTAIKYYELTTQEIGTLASRRRYVSFAVGDSCIAASLFTEKALSGIVLIDPENGKEQMQYATPGNVFVKELASGDEQMLYAVGVDEKGIRLLRLDLKANRWEELLGATSANIASPVYNNKEGKLFFESGLNGTNNLYSLDLSERKVFRLTSARFGAFHPAFPVGGGGLLFADYGAKGHRIAFLANDSLRPREADFTLPARFVLADTLASQEGFRLEDSLLEAIDFHPQPYRKASHLFQIHSWAPVYYNVSEWMSGGASDFILALKPGATLISQNALNTAVTQLGWYYHQGYHHGAVDFTYMGWLPVIRLHADYGSKAFDVVWVKNQEGLMQAVARPTNRNLTEILLQAYIPFNLTENHYTRGIQPGLSYYFTNNAYRQYGQNLMVYFHYLLAELRLYSYRKMAHRDILPRLGYQLRLQYLNLPFHTGNFGDMYLARLTAYLPGAAAHHSLMLRAGYLYQSNDDRPMYIPKQLLESPRGYAYQYRTHQQIALRGDYAFPLATPDLSLGKLAYIRRLRANLFYDVTFNQAEADEAFTGQHATGVDVLLDWNALRFSFPLSTGLRVIRTLTGGGFQTEILFSFSI
ncbi:MAG: hypothetical protein LBD89_01670 [Tannerellaceae bacterium]|nr:hypothetical protein [Tannerellaceae bacterium]